MPPNVTTCFWALDEGGAEGTWSSRQSLPSALVQYYPINYIHHNEHHLYSTLCRVHFLWTRRTGRLPFICLAFQVRLVTFHLVPVQQGLCDCTAVPFLHFGNFVGVFNALQVCGNPEYRAECGAEFWTLQRHMLHAVPKNIIVYCDLVPFQFWSRYVALVV